MPEKKRIIVIGAGVAGIVAAYHAAKTHHVMLLEKNHYIGGHTNTHYITEGPDLGTPVDSGFIVFNDQTYPDFTEFLNELKVPIRLSDMSFGYWDQKTDFRYAYTTFNGVFAQRKNLIDLRFWKLTYELVQFLKKGTNAIRDKEIQNMTLGEFIEREKFSKELQDKFLLPMGSAIWSIPFSKLLDFPAITFLLFFENHGLLNTSQRPNWQTVVGGSSSYVEAFKKKYTGEYMLNVDVASVRRNAQVVEILLKDGSKLTCDKLIIATHADQALKLLEAPSEEEIKNLSAVKYEDNHVVVHTDRSIMPAHKRAWASWNFHRSDENGTCLVTYHMNRLEGLRTHHEYFVTLNSHEIDESKILKKARYSHPIFTKEAIEAQKTLPELNGHQNTYYCGSYFGFGFHEDAVRSANRAIRKLNEDIGL